MPARAQRVLVDVHHLGLVVPAHARSGRDHEIRQQTPRRFRRHGEHARVHLDPAGYPQNPRPRRQPPRHVARRPVAAREDHQVVRPHRRHRLPRVAGAVPRRAEPQHLASRPAPSPSPRPAPPAPPSPPPPDALRQNRHRPRAPAAPPAARRRAAAPRPPCPAPSVPLSPTAPPSPATGLTTSPTFTPSAFCRLMPGSSCAQMCGKGEWVA